MRVLQGKQMKVEGAYLSYVTDERYEVWRSNTKYINRKEWGHSSVGRAPALQAGGQEFESPCLHH